MAKAVALLTRPAGASAPLAEALRARGVDSLIEPLIEIDFLTPDPPDLRDVQALLFSSRNGVEGWSRLSQACDLPAFCVGGATAAAARRAGFRDVHNAAGDAVALADLVASTLDPARGALVHVRGRDTTAALATRLGEANFHPRACVVYVARAAEGLSSGALTALGSAPPRVDWVVLMSPRTGRTFARLVGQDKLAGNCQHLRAFCLSPAVARTVAGLRWKGIHVAARPALPDLLATVDQVMTTDTDRTCS